MKMVKLEDDTWDKLFRMKLDMRAKSLNDVIKEVLRVYVKCKSKEQSNAK